MTRTSLSQLTAHQSQSPLPSFPTVSSLPVCKEEPLNVIPVLYSTSTSNLHKLQMVQNALARTITRSPRSVPTSQLLSNLHWLPINKRTNFKVATLTYKVLSTQQPAYLRNLISYHQSKKLGPGPFCLTNFSARPVQGSTAYKHQSDWP